MKKNGVSNKHLGVSNENMGVSHENVGGLQPESGGFQRDVHGVSNSNPMMMISSQNNYLYTICNDTLQYRFQSQYLPIHIYYATEKKLDTL